MAEQLPMLQAAAREIVLASVTSPLFASRRVESEVSKDLAPNQQAGRSKKLA
jgi:hypothetical protein